MYTERHTLFELTIFESIDMPISRRQDIRKFLTHFFNGNTSEVSIEDCLESYIISRQLGTQYKLKRNESKTSATTSKKERIRLRNQVSQELGVMKQMSLIGRVRYGVYITKNHLIDHQVH